MARSKKRTPRARKPNLEDAFLAAWLANFPELPVPVRQHRFCDRRYAFDFAFPPEKLAIEIQGGAFVRGGHSTALGQAKDYEKNNLAVRTGWRMLFYNTVAFKDIDAIVTEVAEILCNAKEVT